MSDAQRTRYVVGLGANLGDRRGTLRSAVLALGAHGAVARLSHLYETAALGPPQPDYLNAAALLESPLAPRALLDELLGIERRHGRKRRERWGPRTLDLDLLHSPGLTLNEPGLALPHPELTRRPFALLPLLDVLPDGRDQLSGASHTELLSKLDCSSVRRIEKSESWDPRGSG
jgi:2-amino-4-hydroxy-6-hydroxymethyldihydropteridine diphosphokinase